MVAVAVTGSAHHRVLAERADVEVIVRIEGAEREAVYATAATLHEQLVAEARAHAESGAATRWSADRLVVRVFDRYDSEGRRHERLQQAEAGVTVRFADFAVMSAWLDEVAQREGNELPGVGWDLPEARRVEVTREVRAAAVRDAHARAALYAEVIDAAEVVLLQLAEPRQGERTGMVHAFAMSGRSARGEHRGGAIVLRPAEIVISAQIDADFELS